ncbi:hypothetical protein HK405_008546, partial [Cladochytrium tenue]
PKKTGSQQTTAEAKSRAGGAVSRALDATRQNARTRSASQPGGSRRSSMHQLGRTAGRQLGRSGNGLGRLATTRNGTGRSALHRTLSGRIQRPSQRTGTARNRLTSQRALTGRGSGSGNRRASQRSATARAAGQRTRQPSSLSARRPRQFAARTGSTNRQRTVPRPPATRQRSSPPASRGQPQRPPATQRTTAATANNRQTQASAASSAGRGAQQVQKKPKRFRSSMIPGRVLE